MTPFYFGPEERPLFGWHHPPGSGESRGAVVICPPVGWELIRSYRAFRHLSERLSAAGFHVLRFDYDGTGNSAGTDRDPGRVPAWLGSIAIAIDELRALAGVSTVSLIGTRLGGTLAVQAAAQRDDVTSLVAWAPSLTGRAFLREARAFRQLGDFAAPTGLPDGDQEGGGFLLTQETVAALSQLDLSRLDRAPAPRLLVIARDATSMEGRLADAASALGAVSEFRRLPGYADMVLNDMHNSVVPDAVFDAAVAWLAAAHPPGSEKSAARVAPSREMTGTTRMVSQDGSALREDAAFFGVEDRLFGILTRPETPPAGHPPTLILLNNGAVHHVGSQRLYVTMAREWAARGHSVLRMDLGGLGDSRPTGGGGENVMYAANVTDDVREAISWLQRVHGSERFVLLGLCAGAYASFHAGLLGPPVVGTILINPQTFYWTEGDSLEEAPSEVYTALRRYRQSVWKGQTWRKLVRGGVPLGYVARQLVSRARTVAGATLASVPGRLGIPLRGTLAGDLRSLITSGTDVLLVFSENDPGLDYIDLHAKAEVARLRGRDNFRIEIIEGADHTFTPVRSQARLFDTITSHLAARY